MKPTPAQIEYLENARRACDTGRGWFRIHQPGRRVTGRACESREWIVADRYMSIAYTITPAGRAVLEAEEC